MKEFVFLWLEVFNNGLLYICSWQMFCGKTFCLMYDVQRVNVLWQTEYSEAQHLTVATGYIICDVHAGGIAKYSYKCKKKTRMMSFKKRKKEKRLPYPHNTHNNPSKINSQFKLSILNIDTALDNVFNNLWPYLGKPISRI